VERDLVPVDEAMQRLGGISRWTLYRLIRSGELATVTIGRRRFVTDRAIREFVAHLNDAA
jgi:excisionase family DNA binding protein